jgi:2,4-dienoyl-CoA reductase-like NADH-dependent reductase (Old Yellow Enzyme family)
MNSITEHKIFTPFTIGRVSLRHRVVMAPLTRLRSELDYATHTDLANPSL